MSRRIVWKYADLPPRPTGACELKLNDLGPLRGMATLPGGQFGAIWTFIATHYGLVPEGMTPEPKLTDDRFQALLNGLLGRARRLEYDDPPDVLEVMGRAETALHFFLVPPEVPRLPREIVLSLQVARAVDEHGWEVRTVDPQSRIRYQPNGNLAHVEVLRDGQWKLIDMYNPAR